jgi:hypothetical protein
VGTHHGKPNKGVGISDRQLSFLFILVIGETMAVVGAIGGITDRRDLNTVVMLGLSGDEEG